MPLVPMVVKQDPRGERSFDIYTRSRTWLSRSCCTWSPPTPTCRSSSTSTRPAASRTPAWPSTTRCSTSADIAIHAAEALDLRERLDGIFARHTGQTYEQVRADMERDRFFSAHEALQYGLIDRVVDDKQPPGAR